MGQAKAVGTEIVEEVAAREGVDPLDLDAQLYDVIDADALNSLTEGREEEPGDPIRISFTYLDYAITVHEGGNVTVDETD